MSENYANNQWISTHLKIEGTQEFIEKVKVLFNQIWALEGKGELEEEHIQEGHPWLRHNLSGARRPGRIGQEFLMELDAAGKDITVKTGSSFACAGSTAAAYYKLANLSWNTRAAVIPLLRDAIARSPYKTIENLAKQLVTPGPGMTNYAFTPAQVKELIRQRKYMSSWSRANSRIVSPGAILSDRKLESTLLKNVEEQWVLALHEYLESPDATGLPAISNPQQQLICRKLENWLDRGLGNSCQVTCNFASTETTCYFDGTKKTRPMAIAFAHELIHAYYSVTGTRLYNEGSKEDEALTTGLPPEHFRKYSENRFRAVWPDEVLDMRLLYAFGSNLCPFCGSTNAEEERVKSQWVVKRRCSKCGLDLIQAKDLEGDVFHTPIPQI